MHKLPKDSSAKVAITQLSTKGNGLGLYQPETGNQRTLEVPFTMPGDEVNAKIFKKRKGNFQCKLEEVLVPSPNRIPAKCLHFGICGGCRWQHIPYHQQLAYKEAYIKECFSSLLTPELTIHPINACEEPWGYRNKMEFSFSSNQAGEKFLGLMMDASKGKVLNLTECHLVHGWFVDALKAVRDWWENSTIDAYHPYRNTGSLRTLILREGFRSGERLAMLTVSGNPDYAIRQDDLRALAAALQRAVGVGAGQKPLSIFLRIQQIAKGRPTEFYEMQLDGSDTIQETLYITKDRHKEALKFNLSPSAFFQPNPLQAEKIYSYVLQLANIPSDAVVYDLYCGTGTLGICLAKHVKEVIGIELSAESAHDAKENIKLNHLENVRIFKGAVGDVLGKMQHQADIPPPDVVVVDPPRAGLDPDSIRLLQALKPSTLVYVSCNPATQASNIADFIKGGYRLECLQPVDQFPQTVHVENIAILRWEPTGN